MALAAKVITRTRESLQTSSWECVCWSQGYNQGNPYQRRRMSAQLFL